jgi:CheY-like chemotaxis protein
LPRRFLDVSGEKTTVARREEDRRRDEMARTVMVVEDDAAIRELVMQVLTFEGFMAVGAGDGQEALRRLKEEQVRPEVILLDLMMPVMDGWHFRAEQLKDPALAEIPVVVMSAVADGMSAEGHVSKPFDVDALLDAVSRAGAPRPALHCGGAR